MGLFLFRSAIMNRRLLFVPVMSLFLVGCKVGSSIPSESANPNTDSDLNPTGDSRGLDMLYPMPRTMSSVIVPLQAA